MALTDVSSKTVALFWLFCCCCFLCSHLGFNVKSWPQANMLNSTENGISAN